MATSGTTSFNLSIDEIIDEAYNRVGIRPNSGNDMKRARRNLNLLFAEWGNRGVHMWKVELDEVTLVAGQAEYTVSSDVSDVLEAFISTTAEASNDVNTQDVSITKIDRSAYAALPNKLATGQPSQYYIEERLTQIFTKIPQNEKIAFTGGVAQNVLANSKLKKIYKKLFCSPYNNDSGISIGSVNIYRNFDLKIKSIYTGIPQEFSSSCIPYPTKNVTLDEVCNLLEKEPVAIFKKRSESGQRGLGARSILISPCIKSSYEKMNEVKKRAWFRPFALSILDEHGEEWFEDYFYTPFMMYIFNLKKNKKNILKNGLCIKGTSRIQSVRKEDNLEYYNLIHCFYKKTGIPMLVNTSFNLPGEVLVETYSDLNYFLKNSKLKYVYLAEYGKLIYANN